MTYSPRIHQALHVLFVTLILILAASPIAADEKDGSQKKKDEKTEFKEAKAACQNGDMAQCNALGDMYAKGIGSKKNEKQAFLTYKKSCDGGDMLGCKNLGNAYFFGTGVAKDETRAVNLYKRACDGGEMKGCNNLGLAYQRGMGFPTDATHAAAYYKQACDGGELVGCNNLAWMYYNGSGVNKDVLRAVELYRQACEGGYSSACNGLGAMYASGIGTTQSNERAVIFYKIACDNDDAQGCNNLGFMYLKGLGVSKDDEHAANLYLQACENNYASGCTNMGVMYQNGSGVAKSGKRAAELYQQGCDGDDMTGCFYAGNMYKNGNGVENDLKRAAELYEESCEGDYADGCNALGVMHAQGLGVTKNLGYAAELYEKACKGGNKLGCYNLGDKYESGLGVKKDLNRAADLYQKACDIGYPNGCYTLALLYANDMSFAENKQRIVELHKRACEGSHASACYNLGAMYQYGDGVTKDATIAASIYRKACEAGHANSCAVLGFMYMEGKGIGKNLKRAISLYKQACDAGSEKGCFALATMYVEGMGVEKDIQRATVFFEQACSSGFHMSCHSLGVIYENGMGVARDETRALKLFQQACEGGVSESCIAVGLIEKVKPEHATEDRQLAPIFKKMCDGGDFAGCGLLGLFYEIGQEVKQDIQLAISLYAKACDGNYMPACLGLAAKYHLGSGVKKDMRRALSLYEKACEGEKMSCYQLGTIYEHGVDVARNEKKAKLFHQKACESGLDQSCSSACWILGHSGRIASAEQCFENVSVWSSKNGRLAAQGLAKIGTGWTLRVAGDYRGAIAAFEDVVTFSQKNSLPSNRIDGMRRLGLILSELGNYREAKNYFEMALSAIEADGQIEQETDGTAMELILWMWQKPKITQELHSNLGMIALKLNRPKTARKHFTESRKIATSSLDKNGVSNAELNLARVKHSEGSQVETQAYLDATMYANELGATTMKIAVQEQAGDFRIAEGRYREAIDHFNAAIRIAHQVGFKAEEMWGWFNTGRAFERLGKENNALTAYDNAMKLADSLMEKAGGEDEQKGFREHLQQIYEAPIRLRSERIQKLKKSGDSNSEILERNKTFAVLEKGRARVMVRRMAQMGVRQNGQLPAHLIEKENDLRNRIDAINRLISGEVQRKVTKPDIDVSGLGKNGVTPASLKIEHKIEYVRVEATKEDYAKLDALYKKRQAFADKLWSNPETVAYAALNYPRPVEPKDIGLKDNEVLVEFMVGEQGVYRWILFKNELVAFDELKISPEELAEEVGGMLNLVTTKKSPQQISHSLYKLLIHDAMGYLPKKNGRLIIVADGLLATLPFEYLNQSGGSGARDEKPLGLEYPIVYAPSARAIELARKGITGSDDAYNKQLLAVGDPVYLPGMDQRCGVRLSSTDRNHCDWKVTHALKKQSRKLGLFHGSQKLAMLYDSEIKKEGEPITANERTRGNDGYYRLCHTRTEVEEVSKSFVAAESDVLMDFEPTRTRVINLLNENKYETIHFSTHGVMPSANDNSRFAQPAIVLAAVSDRERNTEESKYLDRLVSDEQLLTMKDIFESRIPAKQVTLSACHSGQGEQIKGEGVQGMGQAFLYAGAQTVVMSLWSVNDKSTAEWMKIYYSEIQNGKDRAEAALAARKAIHAQSGFDQNWNKPYYWAPFIVVGVER